MELIKWDSLKEDHIFDEDFKTVAHNIWTGALGGRHSLNSKNWSWALSALTLNPVPALIHALGFRDIIDKKYLDAHWVISNKAKEDIAKQCARIQNALLITDALKAKMKGRFSDAALATDVATSNTRLASRDIGDGAMTTATTPIKVKHGNGYYIVYVTFDASKIYDLKVLCQDPKNEEIHKSFYVQKISFNPKSIQSV